jgi:hypothetical protein
MIDRFLRHVLEYLKQLVSIIWHGTPWALGLLFCVMFFAFRLSILSVLRWFAAVPEASRRFADDWVMRARKAEYGTESFVALSWSLPSFPSILHGPSHFSQWFWPSIGCFSE